MRILKIAGPVGRALGLLPMLRVFRESELATSIAQAGFTIELQWRPGKKSAVFFIARKSAMENTAKPELVGPGDAKPLEDRDLSTVAAV